MPRSARHKSSKHSSRDAREFSESEDDLGVKERRENEEESGMVRVSKDSVLSEKRKFDGSKESRRDAFDGSGNGEHVEDYANSSSKRRKERVSTDGVSDRWNGGDENVDEKGEGSRKMRGSGESKSRRREDEMEEVKRSGGRSEKHSRESSRKEGKERDRERDKEKERERDRDREKEKEKEKERDRDREKERDRDREKERDRDRDSERKGKEGKGEKFGDYEDERLSSKREITTDSKADVHVRNSDSENLLERRIRKRRENSAEKYQDDIGDGKSKHASSVDDVVRDRRKDEKQRDEKYKDKYRDEIEKSRQDKYKDGYCVKDRSRSRSKEKYSRDDKDLTDVRQKKTKPRDGDQENDFQAVHDYSHQRDRDQDRDKDREHDGYRKRDQVCGSERDRNPMLDKERERDWDYDRDREHVHDQEPDLGHYDERSGRYKDRKGRRKSLDDQDEYGDGKVRGCKTLNTDLDKVSLSGNRVEADGRGDGSRSRQAHGDITPSSNRRRVSPASSSHGGDDGYRRARQEDLKYRDLQMESRLKANSAGAAERSSKYRSSEKHHKMDDGLLVELTGERSASSKPSPMGLTDGSPSSPSLDRRYMNRSGVRRSLDVEDGGRRSGASADSRDFSVAEGKVARDIPSEKFMVEESSQVDSSFHNRQSQGNVNPPPSFRPGVESPSFMGMLEEDSRPNTNARYKRTGDHSLGRGHMNTWRGMPNWSSPLPNGFMPFQSGPPHGNFQSIIPHFPSPPLFGVRPPVDINQPGMPFPLADTDRFPGHLRPLGWPNMIDPSGPPRLHGWDVNNGVLRGESHLYGGPDWEHNRHPINAREWETSVDMWKGHNGGATDVPSATDKDSSQVQFPVEDAFAGRVNRKSNNENSHEGSQLKSAEMRPVLTPPQKETSKLSPEVPSDKKQDSTKVVEFNNAMRISRFYLSRLDISEELTHPEVYKQCVDLLDGKPSLTVADDPLVRIILKNDRRGGLRHSDDPLSSSVLPSTDDSTFQKAVELYKNLRLEMRDIAMVKVNPLDSIPSTDLNELLHQRVATENEEKPALKMDEEKLQSPLVMSGQVKNVDVANTGKEDRLDLSGLESVESNNIPSQNVHELENEGVVKRVESNAGSFEHAELPDDIPQAAAANVDAAMVVQTGLDDIATGADSSGKVVSDSVVVGGPSEACEVVSNESELVNLSRIHHSPESTH